MTVYETLACISVGAVLVFVGRVVWALRGFRVRTDVRWAEMDKQDDAYLDAYYRRANSLPCDWTLWPPVRGGRRFAYHDVVELLRHACSERDALIAAVVGRYGDPATTPSAAVERAKRLREERFQLIEAICGTPAATAVERGVAGAVAIARAKEHARQLYEMRGPDAEGRWGPPEDVLADVKRAVETLRKAEEAEPGSVDSRKGGGA